MLEEQQILGVMDRSYDTLEYAYPELEVISPLLSANEMASFNWSVSPGTRMVSNQFWVTKGDRRSMWRQLQYQITVRSGSALWMD